MLRYALHRLQLAHAVGECILRRGGSDALFPNDFGEDLFVQVSAAVDEPAQSLRHAHRVVHKDGRSAV